MADSMMKPQRPTARETEIVALTTFMDQPLEVWLGADVTRVRVAAFIGISHPLLIPSYFLKTSDAERPIADLVDEVLRLMREKVPLPMLMELNQSAPELRTWLTPALQRACVELAKWAQGLAQRVRAGEIDV